MWPRRKILFIIPRGVEGWQGMLSLLEALHKDVIVRETSDDAPVDLTNLTFPGVDQEGKDLSDVGPTEILYWSGVPLEDGYRQWGLARGLDQMELPEFLHRYWEEDILLPQTQTAIGDGEPLLWRFLEGAGFEPSLLWKTPEGGWTVRIGRGMHWILPEELLRACCGMEGVSFGRLSQTMFPTSFWVYQGDWVDFYSAQENFAYLGSFERSLNSSDQEQGIYDTILLALRLGVPWKEIQRIYHAILKSPREDMGAKEKDLRWYVDVTSRDTWSSGTELPTEGFEYLEGWGIG